MYLNECNKKPQVFPTFILPLTIKFMLDWANPNMWSYDWLFGEHYFQQIRPLPPKGIINIEIKPFDVLDKGKGSLYCYNSKDIHYCSHGGPDEKSRHRPTNFLVTGHLHRPRHSRVVIGRLSVRVSGLVTPREIC